MEARKRAVLAPLEKASVVKRPAAHVAEHKAAHAVAPKIEPKIDGGGGELPDEGAEEEEEESEEEEEEEDEEEDDAEPEKDGEVVFNVGGVEAADAARGTSSAEPPPSETPFEHGSEAPPSETPLERAVRVLRERGFTPGPCWANSV